MLAAIIIVWVITVFTFNYYCASLCIVPPPPPPKRHSLNNSPFRKLPLELVGYMAEFLTPSAAACFTLACKPIWFILGNQYLDRLWARDFEPSRRTFLELLDKDLPYHVICLQCNQLQRGDRKRHHSLLLSLCGTRPLCEVAEREQEVHRYINPNFNYVSLQSVMKLHRSGSYEDYDSKIYDMIKSRNSLLSYNKFSRYDTYAHQKQSYIYVTEGPFLYREQDLLRFRHIDCIISCSKRDCIACWGGGEDFISTTLLSLVVCPHLQSPLKKAATKTRFEAIMTFRASHWDDIRLNNTCATCSGLHQCHTCPTEFQLDTMDYGYFDRRLILTRWLDLGEGRTPEDPKWKSHIGSRDHSTENPIHFEAGSIKAAIEEDQDQHFLSLNSWLVWLF